jgi:hypothetical protein
MVTAWIILGLLVVLCIAAVYDTRRRRSVLDATMPAGASRTARRRIRREQRAKDRAARARYAAEHPYLHGGGDGGGL